MEEASLLVSILRVSITFYCSSMEINVALALDNRQDNIFSTHVSQNDDCVSLINNTELQKFICQNTTETNITVMIDSP
jgi:hypothetical protein